MWDSIKGMLGKTAGDFVQSLGDTPEERQMNLKTFSDAIGTINQVGAQVQQTSLLQRLGAKRGAEMVDEARNAPPPQPMTPLPPISPEMIQDMLNNVGLGVSGIQSSTGAIGSPYGRR
jgi:hypothetical protein